MFIVQYSTIYTGLLLLVYCIAYNIIILLCVHSEKSRYESLTFNLRVEFIIILPHIRVCASVRDRDTLKCFQVRGQPHDQCVSMSERRTHDRDRCEFRARSGVHCAV